jgi:hypothetical protein
VKITRDNTLYDITGQESGIVVYGDSVIVVNWASQCPNGGMPMMAPLGIDGIIEWPSGNNLISKPRKVKDIRERLPGVMESAEEDGETVIKATGMHILYDINCDIPRLFGFLPDEGAGNEAEPTGGMIYSVKGESCDAIVIAPDGWH